MRITTLIENRACNNLSSEHGLSLWVEYNGKSYLLDTGSTNLFSENAASMGIDLGKASLAVLSHGHYDHSGGFEAFFAKNLSAKVYLQESAKERCYGVKGEKKRYIGIPEGILEKYEDRFVYIDAKTEVDEGVWLLPHTTANLAERGARMGMYRAFREQFVPDDFAHEQSLVFELGEQLVILNSCCHAGVENVIEEVKQSFCGKDVLAVFGGFHLKGKDGIDSMGVTTEEVERLSEKLKASGVKYIYTGHCTGTPAYRILKENLGDKVQYLGTGTVVEF